MIVITNGGEALADCPTDWDWAKKWQEAANNNIEDGPKWSWDCGFKLDFDGPIISVSSRFYPPKSHYGSTWDGTCTISILGKVAEEKKFDCPSLEELRRQVEAYIKSISERIRL